MKLLYITEFFPTSEDAITGGVEAHVFHLTKQLKGKITVLTSRRHGEKKKVRKGNITIHRCGIPYSYSNEGSILKRFSFVIDAFLKGLDLKFDLVHGFSFLCYPVAGLLGVFKDKPRIATYHESWIGRWIKNKGFLTGMFGEVWERFALFFKWNHIIAVSEITKKQLHSYKRLPVTVIHNGANIEAAKRTRAKKQRVISYVGRLTEHKRVDVLIKAIAQMKKLVPLVVAGQGPELKKLQALAKKLDVKVIWKGFLKTHAEVLKTIKGSTIFCHPSELEGFGIVLVEAMACEVPVVCSSIPPFREVSAGATELFPQGDAAALAKKLDTLLSSEKKRRSLIEKGKKRAALFSWKEKARLTKQIYARVLKKR